MPAPTTSARFSLRLLFVLVFVAGLALALILPAVEAAKAAARQIEASNNAKGLAMGLLNYDVHNRSLPPAVTLNAQGQASYGWRLSVCVFLESIGTGHPYHNVDRTLPWDDPINLKACQLTIPIFLRPGERNRVEHATNFVVVRGPGTFFPDDSMVSLHDLKDDPATTILVVEIGNSDIPWYEPRDLHIEQMSFRINDPQQPSIGSRSSRGAIVAMADGSVRHLPADTPPETIRAMLTIAGGETIPPLP